MYFVDNLLIDQFDMLLVGPFTFSLGLLLKPKTE